MLYLNQHKTKYIKEYPRMASITQDMRFRLSLIQYAERHGVSNAARKYKTNRQYIYRWKNRYDGSGTPSETAPDVLIPIQISIPLRKSSSFRICAGGILTPGWSYSGSNSRSGAINARSRDFIVSSRNKE